MHGKRPEIMENLFLPQFLHPASAYGTQPANKSGTQTRIMRRLLRQLVAVTRECRVVVTEMVGRLGIACRYTVLRLTEKRPQHKQTDTEILRFVRPGHNIISPRLITINQITQPVQ